MRPTIKADQVDTPNILFPRWFLRDPNKLLSDSWKPKAKLGDYWAHKSSSELFFLSNLVLGFRVISKTTVLPSSRIVAPCLPRILL